MIVTYNCLTEHSVRQFFDAQGTRTSNLTLFVYVIAIFGTFFYINYIIYSDLLSGCFTDRYIHLPDPRRAKTAVAVRAGCHNKTSVPVPYFIVNAISSSLTLPF